MRPFQWQSKQYQPSANSEGNMSTVFPDNRSSAPLARRSVLLGLAASSLSAPAIVRASIIMPVRRVLLTERPSAGFVQRLFYNWLAADLRGGHMTTVINGSVVSLSEAERLVGYARKNGWIVEPLSVPGDTQVTAEDLR
jgi:hypothetical protein